MLHDSRDQKVRQADITVQTGHKWSASRAAAEAEARPRQKDIVGWKDASDPRWKDASAKGRRSFFQEELRMAMEEDRQAKAVSMKRQGSCTRWNGVQGRSLGWKKGWSM